MDSDSTEPQTDEVAAKSHEINKFQSGSFDISYDDSPDFVPSGSKTTKYSKKRLSSSRCKSSKMNHHAASNGRPVREGRRPPARVSDVYTSDGSESESAEPIANELKSSLSPRSFTRMAYQKSHSSLWSLEDVMEKSDTLLGPPVSNESAPTQEQLEIRQRRIERRRESAKNKAEREMQETVERLLRINADYAGGSGGVANRGRRAATTTTERFDSGDSTDEGGKKDKRRENALHPSLPLDPPPGFVRFISSQRLQPHSLVALPAVMEGADGKDMPSLLKQRMVATPPKQPQMCDQCKVAPRRYGCPRTGRSLCSLQCFKAS